MKTENKKRTYSPPTIEKIVLDKEISLALESSATPPTEPTGSLAPEYFNNDPFKSYMG